MELPCEHETPGLGIQRHSNSVKAALEKCMKIEKKIIEKCNWGDFEGVYICDFENISSGIVEWLLFFEVLLNHVFGFTLDTEVLTLLSYRNQPIDSQ